MDNAQAMQVAQAIGDLIQNAWHVALARLR
jgi:hypothetical protein